MNWKIGAAVGIAILIIAIGIGTFFVFADNEETQTKEPIHEEIINEETDAENSDDSDINTEVTNTPAEKSIITLNSGKDGHSFIRHYHDFYNRTLCWGRIETADYNAQKETAQKLLEEMDGAIIQDEKLIEDFEMIRHYASAVVESDDRGSMRMLHRYFHDLDIYLNGYDGDQAWGVTAYKGN